MELHSAVFQMLLPFIKRFNYRRRSKSCRFPLNIPVSVETIRDNTYNSNCPSANPSYFGAYNLSGLDLQLILMDKRSRC
jgi:hypothetical protein